MSRRIVLLQLALGLCLQLSSATSRADWGRASNIKCEEDKDCRQDAHCQFPQGYCQCNTGYMRFEDECLPVPKQLGDTCIVHIQCQVAFGEVAECEHGICQCPAGSHFAEGLCHNSIKIGGKCAVRSDCYTTSGAPVSCVQSQCTCHQNFHPSAASDDCIKNVGLGGACARNEECVINNSNCYTTCSCQAAYIASADNQTCLPVAHTLGDGCERNEQCQQVLQLTVCRDQSCVCRDGAHQQNGKCWTDIPLNGICESTQECRTTSNLAGSVKCDSTTNRCVCAPEFITKPGDCVSHGSSTLKNNMSAILIFIVTLLCSIN